MASNQFKIKRKNHPNKKNFAFCEFLKNSQFTDVMLVAGGGTLDAHRVILASSSTYFYNLFLSKSCDMKRAQMCLIENTSFIDLNNIVQFIYFGELMIDRDYLTHFIHVADLFGVQDIHDLEIDIADSGLNANSTTNIEKDQDLLEMLDDVKDPVEINIEVPGPSKKPNILRSASKSAEKLDKLRVLTVKKVSISEDEKSFMKQLNLIPKVEAKVRPKSASKKHPKRLVIKLPRSARRSNTIGTHKMECRYCSRPYNVASSLRNHEKFCILNDKRSISTCNICNEEVKPGSMTFHRKRYHDIMPQSRRLTIDVQMHNAEY